MVYPPRQAERFNQLMRHKEALDTVISMAPVQCNQRLHADLTRLRAKIQECINALVETESVMI